MQEHEESPTFEDVESCGIQDPSGVGEPDPRPDPGSATQVHRFPGDEDGVTIHIHRGEIVVHAGRDFFAGHAAEADAPGAVHSLGSVSPRWCSAASTPFCSRPPPCTTWLSCWEPSPRHAGAR